MNPSHTYIDGRVCIVLCRDNKIALGAKYGFIWKSELSKIAVYPTLRGANLAPAPARNGRSHARWISREIARLNAGRVWDVLEEGRGRGLSGMNYSSRNAYRASSVRCTARGCARVWVYDDVVVTGATMRACTAALTAAGFNVTGYLCLYRYP